MVPYTYAHDRIFGPYSVSGDRIGAFEYGIRGWEAWAATEERAAAHGNEFFLISSADAVGFNVSPAFNGMLLPQDCVQRVGGTVGGVQQASMLHQESTTGMVRTILIVLENPIVGLRESEAKRTRRSTGKAAHCLDYLRLCRRECGPSY